MKKTKKVTHKNLILRICIFAFVVYAAVTLVDMQMTIAARKQELTQVMQSIETQRMLNKELERKIENGIDEETIERIARDKLDYVYPDDVVFIDISGS